MKVLAESPARFQDSADLVALITASRRADMELARESLRLITERGANRQKDLLATLERYIALASADNR